MKVQECSFRCDRPDCFTQSPACPSWTEARKAAELRGWFIRPAENKPEHVCPDCVESQLLALKEPADQGRKAS
jgi:hypothetical protein